MKMMMTLMTNILNRELFGDDEQLCMRQP